MEVAIILLGNQVACQLREAEQILSNALDRAEAFSEHDKQIINRIRSDVDMADLTLLQLLSPIAPR